MSSKQEKELRLVHFIFQNIESQITLKILNYVLIERSYFERIFVIYTAYILKRVSLLSYRSYDEILQNEKREFLHGIKQKSKLLANRYLIKQSHKNLSEHKRVEEMEKLQQKYVTLENTYKNVAMNIEQKELELRKLRIDVWNMNSNIKSSKTEIATLAEREIKEKNEVLVRENAEREQLQALFQELQTKSSKIKEEMICFKHASLEQKHNLIDQIKTHKETITRQKSRLKEFEEGHLGNLKERLKLKQSAIENGNALQTKLVQKYQKLRRSLQKLEQVTNTDAEVTIL